MVGAALVTLTLNRNGDLLLNRADIREADMMAAFACAAIGRKAHVISPATDVYKLRTLG